ncbi:MAG: glycosyltransferase [Patescibacteria group bacterium]|nr:glycosyltransferase [Patescibacteria group bacterium]
MKSLAELKIALVHDQLLEFGGAERVLVSLKKIFPHADIFTTCFRINSLGSHKKLFKRWSVTVSWFGKLPLVNRFYSPFRFLTPLIWESFNFSRYDLVISSSGSWMSKGILTRKPTIHICYLHHPPRYLYDYETAIEWQRYLPVRIYGTIVNHSLRLWDFQSAQRPDFLIANSVETQKRIEKFYRRKSTVIYPPVAIPKTIYNQEQKNYFITISRLAKPKHIEVLIEAANKKRFSLKIIGTGREERFLRSIAGEMVEFLGDLPDNQFEKVISGAKAFLFASKDEEFGIACLEAMGYGIPVIAYNSGGIPEYLVDGKNGFLFDYLNYQSLVDKIKKLNHLSKKEYHQMRRQARKTAERFSEEKFKKKISDFITKAIKKANSLEKINPNL